MSELRVASRPASGSHRISTQAWLRSSLTAIALLHAGVAASSDVTYCLQATGSSPPCCRYDFTVRMRNTCDHSVYYRVCIAAVGKCVSGRMGAKLDHQVSFHVGDANALFFTYGACTEPGEC